MVLGIGPFLMLLPPWPACVRRLAGCGHLEGPRLPPPAPRAEGCACSRPQREGNASPERRALVNGTDVELRRCLSETNTRRYCISTVIGNKKEKTEVILSLKMKRVIATTNNHLLRTGKNLFFLVCLPEIEKVSNRNCSVTNSLVS